MACTTGANSTETTSGWIILASPFRLFFLLAGGYAVVVMVPWLALLTGHLAWEGAMAPAVWHGHEMIFGYTVAVIAGFLLTAVADWTQLRSAPAGISHSSACYGWRVGWEWRWRPRPGWPWPPTCCSCRPSSSQWRGR